MKKGQLTAEIVRPGLYSMAMSLPDPESMGVVGGRHEYSTLLTDARVAGDVRLRIAGTTGLAWQLVGGADNVRQHVQGVLDSLPFQQDMREILSAIVFGFSVTEIVWKQLSGTWVPEALKSRDIRHFSFNEKHELLWDSPLGMRVLDMPHKFIVHKNNPRAENPYGTSDLQPCWWLYQFKKAGWQYWLQLADRFGVPSILALFDLDTTDPKETKERTAQLAADLSRLKSDSAGSFANVRDVKTIEASGSIADFNILISACNAEISYAITGQVLATQEAKHGTRAQAEVHERSLETIIYNDAVALSNTLNTSIIKSIVDLQFGAQQEYPRIVFDTTRRASFNEVLQAIDRGVAVSASALYEKYGVPAPTDPKDSFLGGDRSSNVALSDSNSDSVFF